MFLPHGPKPSAKSRGDLCCGPHDASPEFVLCIFLPSMALARSDFRHRGMQVAQTPLLLIGEGSRLRFNVSKRSVLAETLTVDPAATSVMAV